MPQYSFVVHDGLSRPVADGLDLPDVRAARAEALSLAGQMIKDAGVRMQPDGEWAVEVFDYRGLLLFRVDLLITASPVFISEQ